ncbi:MAG: hypothetical protein AB1505_36390 [Candidatus Latescibacterota bacterium]
MVQTRHVVPLDQVARVARLYGSNQEASRALGVTMRAFGRICRRHGIETPYARQRRHRQEARQHQAA